MAMHSAAVLTRWVLFLLCFVVPMVNSAIGEDGLCSLYTFVPFTNNGSASVSIWRESVLDNPGFNHMAAALMAMEHFNTRNKSVIFKLAEFRNCTIQFDFNKSLVFDTGTVGHAASRSLYRQPESPCAIAGPFNDQPGLELSAMATAGEFPLVASRAFNTRLSSSNTHPYSSQVYPGLVSTSVNLVKFLIEKGRTNYTSFLYALKDVGTQRRELLSLAFDSFDMRSQSYPYFPLPEEAAELDGPRDVYSAMKRMKKNGYRTIVVAMGDPSLEMPLLADAAEKLQLNNGDYFWVWWGLFEPTHLENHTENMRKLIYGSAWFSPIEETFLFPDSLFDRAWRAQGSYSVDRLNAMNPIQPGEPGYVFANSTYFQDVEPDFGAGYIYDAVMTIGMGACLAAQNQSSNGSSVIEGAAHVDGIRSADFYGASGIVVIANDPGALHTRLPETVTWVAFNFLPSTKEKQASVDVTDVFFPGDTDWIEIAPFVYADGRTVPPDLLRDQPEQNYLSSGLRAFGLALMSVALFLAVLSAIWVFIHRKHVVLRAAQPPFLYMLAFGSAVMASTIFTLSFDESYGWSEQQLSRACRTSPWLVCLGLIITDGALFSKLWRVNRVLQFARRKVDVRHVIWPSAILFLVAIIILTVWTAVDPLRWVRIEINAETGESIGECHCDHAWAYLAPLMGILLATTFMVTFMAWKTKDVDDAYSEAKWIFIVVLVQMEVMLVATPIVIILYDTSSDGRHTGLVLTVWIFAMSTLLLIMIPKVIAYRKAVGGNDDADRPKRGEHAHGRVTGMAAPNERKHAATQVTEVSEVGATH